MELSRGRVTRSLKAMLMEASRCRGEPTLIEPSRRRGLTLPSPSLPPPASSPSLEEEAPEFFRRGVPATASAEDKEDRSRLAACERLRSARGVYSLTFGSGSCDAMAAAVATSLKAKAGPEEAQPKRATRPTVRQRAGRDGSFPRSATSEERPAEESVEDSRETTVVRRVVRLLVLIGRTRQL